jgi:hypothetical protein
LPFVVLALAVGAGSAFFNFGFEAGFFFAGFSFAGLLASSSSSDSGNSGSRISSRSELLASAYQVIGEALI